MGTLKRGHRTARSSGAHAIERPTWLPMNRQVERDPVEPWNLFGGMNIKARQSLALPTRIGSWSQCVSKINGDFPHNGRLHIWQFFGNTSPRESFHSRWKKTTCSR